MRRAQCISSDDQHDDLEAASRAGVAWAQRCVDELTRAGRPVAGGWPGTLKEAMAHLLAAIGERVTRRDLSTEYLQDLARAAYSSARNTWLAVSLRDEEP
jgi:hypothetical protein